MIAHSFHWQFFRLALADSYRRPMIQSAYYQGDGSMWRAFFMGVGVFVCVLGAECMVTDRFIFASDAKSVPASPVFAAAVAKKRELVPPEHSPWTLLSIGAVSILYSLTLPKLGGGGAPPPPQ